MQTATIDWYDHNAESYFTETADLDNQRLLSEFLLATPNALPILDLGCGSGRDLVAIMKNGRKAFGMEPAAGLADLARAHAKTVILDMTAETASMPEATLAGVWACASLLHVARADLPAVFRNINRWIVPGGTFFTCFKDGDGDAVDARGRHFTNLSQVGIEDLALAAGFKLIRSWQTESIVPGRKQLWNNILVRKSGGPYFAD